MGRSISSLTKHYTDATGCPYCNTLHASYEHRLCACFSRVASWLLLRIISAHSLYCRPYSAEDTDIILKTGKSRDMTLAGLRKGRGCSANTGAKLPNPSPDCVACCVASSSPDQARKSREETKLKGLRTNRLGNIRLIRNRQVASSTLALGSSIPFISSALLISIYLAIP